MLHNVLINSIATNEAAELMTMDWFITSTAFVNEELQVARLHQRILDLEKAEKVDGAQIISLKTSVQSLMFEVEEKQLFMRRLNSLETLKNVAEALTTELTLKEAQLWQLRLANVVKSAKKQAISQQVKRKITALQEVAEQTQKDLWMSELIQNKHERFINLTASARAAVLKELATNEAALQYIDSYIDRLEANVLNLKEEIDSERYKKKLEKLPLKSFASFTDAEKDFIVKVLIEQPRFKTIRDLEVIITNTLQAHQQIGRIKLANDTEATVILLEDDVNQLVEQGAILK